MTTFIGEAVNESSPFPDGQPHVAFPSLKGRIGEEYILKCRICSPKDLMNVALAVDVLHSHKMKVKLYIYYLMGGRMDRRLSDREPYTLKVVCDFINSLDVDSVQVFCPHSKTTIDLLDRYDETKDLTETIFQDMACQRAVRSLVPEYKDMEEPCPLVADVRQLLRTARISFVFPDEGAKKRYAKTELLSWWPNANLVTLSKDREERTGIVHGMKLVDGEPLDTCVILDDLCDGGATFKGAAKCLRQHGAKKIALVVAHGIFSKGLPIEGIDWVACTNSFAENVSGINYLHLFK